MSSSTIANPLVSFGAAGMHNFAVIISNSCGTDTHNGSIVVDICNGIEDLEISHSFTSYYDNVNNNIILSFVNFKQGTYSFNVTNTLGQIILNDKINISTNEEKVIIPFTDTSKGIYLINVFNNDSKFNGKFMK